MLTSQCQKEGAYFIQLQIDYVKLLARFKNTVCRGKARMGWLMPGG